jgi:hypothetical protein
MFQEVNPAPPTALLDRAITQALSRSCHTGRWDQAYGLIKPLKDWESTPLHDKPARWEKTLQDFDAFMKFSGGEDYPLHAAEDGHKDIVELVITYLDKGLDKNKLLNAAVKYQHKEIVELLLFDTNFEMSNEILQPAVDGFENGEILKLLLDRLEAQKGSLGIKGNDAIVEATCLHQDWALKLFLASPLFDLNSQTSDSPLWSAIIRTRAHFKVQWLLSHASMNLSLTGTALVAVKEKIAILTHKRTWESDRFDYNDERETAYLEKFIKIFLENKLTSQFCQEALLTKEIHINTFLEKHKAAELAPKEVRKYIFEEINKRVKLLDDDIELKISALLAEQQQFSGLPTDNALLTFLGNEQKTLLGLIRKELAELFNLRGKPNDPTEQPIGVAPGNSINTTQREPTDEAKSSFLSKWVMKRK